MGRRRRAASASSAARDSTSWSRCRMLYTLAPSAGSTSTQGRLDAASRSASLPRQSRRPELQLGMHVRQPPLPASDPGQVGRGQPQRLSAAPQACALSLNSRKLCASPSAGKRPRTGCPLPRADPGHARLPSRPTRQSRQQVPVPLGHTDTPCPCVSRPPGAGREQQHEQHTAVGLHAAALGVREHLRHAGALSAGCPGCAPQMRAAAAPCQIPSARLSIQGARAACSKDNLTLITHPPKPKTPVICCVLAAGRAPPAARRRRRRASATRRRTARTA